MDLLQKQRESVAKHIRLENEHHWANVNTTLVQDDRAFFDFVPVGQFKGAQGVRQLYHVISTTYTLRSRRNTTCLAARFAKDISPEHTWVSIWAFQLAESKCALP